MTQGRDLLREFVEELKSKADILQVVGDVVSLRRSGRSYVGLCPFHGEKTPSFNVDPGRQLYKCFGCGKGGDVISFVQEQENLGFMDAARRLAERFGVALPELKPRSAAEQAQSQRKDRARAALEAAQELFEARLYDRADPEARAARQYLKGRGLGSDACRPFGIGYAPRDPGLLEAALGSQGHSPEALVDAGLIRLDSGGGARSYFRGRVTFPIRSASGRLLGFGGRVLGEGY